MLVSLAQWMMYLARPLVQDRPLPWQKVQTQLTPGRVQRGLGAIFSQIGTPAGPPKTRGKSPEPALSAVEGMAQGMAQG